MPIVCLRTPARTSALILNAAIIALLSLSHIKLCKSIVSREMAVGASVSLTCSSAAARKSRNTAKSEDDIPDEGSSTSLRERVCMILNEAQKSNTGQRKLVVGLRKIQEACCYEPTHPKKQNPAEDFDENDFNIELVRGILRVLPVKRSEPVGDRLVRFAGSFLKHATELGMQFSILHDVQPD